MEILSIVLEGALEHKDTLGNGSVIRPGEIQRMSAGAGIKHSEFNHSLHDIVHFLQIWIEPCETGIEPSYEQRAFPEGERRNTLRLVASRDGRDGSVTIVQDTGVYGCVLDRGEEVVHEIYSGRHAWIQVARGAIAFNGYMLLQGDGAAVSGEQSLKITGKEPADFILFDLA
jgi:hypothetical protein